MNVVFPLDEIWAKGVILFTPYTYSLSATVIYITTKTDARFLTTTPNNPTDEMWVKISFPTFGVVREQVLPFCPPPPPYTHDYARAVVITGRRLVNTKGVKFSTFGNNYVIKM